MATAVAPRHSPAGSGEPARDPVERVASLRDLAKFTGTVALLAILADAALGHALLWENDPYWTYWVTKTFLIATVFGLGTAWLGLGLARGAAITAVHTAVLTVYYWSLSPIGLPSHPHWLDLEHTWITGVPVHFGVIYVGYAGALWLWRRRDTAVDGEPADLAAEAASALAVGAGIVVVAGLIEAIALGSFPGLTWFVVRLLIAVPFTIAWWAAAGRDRAAAVGGGIVLTLILLTYSHFLGPVGLPDTDLRLIAQDPPPATVHWLSYRDEFLIALPITLVVAVAGFVVAAAWRGRRWTPMRIGGTQALVAAVAVVLLAGLGAIAADQAGPGDDRATVMSGGTPRVEQGEYYLGQLTPTDGDLHLVAVERNPRTTPLPPHDGIDLTASFTHPDGTQYEVRATQPVVDDPMGRFGTWWGVGFDQWHHGRSGIGSDQLPATHSSVAVFALAEVRADGNVVATGVPVHAMTMDDGMVELDVGDPDAPVASLPDGHLRVVWDEHRGGSPEAPERARNAYGVGLLLALLALVVIAVRQQAPRAGRS